MFMKETLRQAGADEKMGRLAVYTAIFGKADDLHEPTFVPANCDFICFTDQPFRSKTWMIRKVEPPIQGDGTRSNRYYKILAHKVLPEYETSVYIDGNVLVRGDISELASRYLSDADLAVFDHAAWKALPIRSLKEELGSLLENERRGKHQEDANLMERQVAAYAGDGYPDDRGLSWNMMLIRRHHAPDVVRTMEAWWAELLKWSKRDQLSFNYVAWKTGLSFSYIPLDGSDNPYTKRLNHHLDPRRKARAYWIGAMQRVRRLFGSM